MAIVYRIYANDGAGGPLDYTNLVGTTGTLAFSPPALAAGSDWTFGVRAFDDATGLEESNTDARVRIRVDAAGVLVGDLPNPPVGLTVSPRPGDLVFARWSYAKAGQAAPPTGFRVYLAPGTVTLPAAPAATVPFSDSGVFNTYSAQVGPITPGVAYQVVVTAYNAAGETAPAPQGTATVEAPASPPSAPVCLPAVVVN